MIFIDPLKLYTGKRILYAHMVSDTSLEELHAFALSIGVKRHFFHRGNHYDIRENEHPIAIAKGAQLVTPKELVRKMIKK